MNSAGWDIGGAHVKLALLADKTLQVHQWYCPLWRGIDELQQCLQQAKNVMHDQSYQHKVTMTGELVDAFSSKADGVQQIVQTFVDAMGEDQVQFFTQEQMLTTEAAMSNVNKIASANWLASGVAVAEVCSDALFIDMGSTTTDLLMIKNSVVNNFGNSDFERLRSGELVYTGVVRSCVNTICAEIPFAEKMTPMMAEYFANSADVYRILEMLPEHADLGETCDGRDKSPAASFNRLSSMIGLDYAEQDNSAWMAAAEYIADQQRKMLGKQIQRFINSYGCTEKIVGAGVGRFLLKILASELEIEYVDFSDLVLGNKIKFDEHAADCAPAISLALA